MKKIPLLLIALMASGLVIVHFDLKKADASATNPTLFSMIALFSGWNSSLPPGTVTGCSPSGQASCNPMITQFRGVAFSATIKWGGAPEATHDFAVYTADITPDNATIFDTCSLTAHSGCLKKSNPVSSTAQSAPFAFLPTIPADGPPFNGPGTYQYYCQYHPGTMHGSFQIFKSPDLNGNGTVDIQDLATIAFYFGQSTTTASQTADLNNDGKINILDLAQCAFYWADTI